MIRMVIPAARFRKIFFLLILICAIIIGLYIRLLPFDIVFGSYPRLEGVCDTWFLLTQVETTLHNFPMYSWFYPAIGSPEGLVTIEMNPLLPLVSATILLLAGSVQPAAEISTISFIPVLCGLLLIPVLYVSGLRMYGQGAGIIAAALVIVVPSVLSRTVLGYLDHHCFEILFSAAFCYFFIRMIPALRDKDPDDTGAAVVSCRDSVISALPASFFFALGILNVITMAVFFAIVTIVLTIAYAIPTFRRFNRKRLLISYGVVFFPSAIILMVLGVVSHSPVVLQTFGMLALALSLGGVWFWFIDCMQRKSEDKGLMIFFPFMLLVLVCVLTVLSRIYIPETWDLIWYFFAYPYTLNLEWAPLTLEGFWMMYGFSVIPVSLGVVICLYHIVRKKSPDSLFLFVWFIFFLIASFQHQRHLYYLDLPMVILASAGLAWTWNAGGIFCNQILSAGDDTTGRRFWIRQRAGNGGDERTVIFDNRIKFSLTWSGRIIAAALFVSIMVQFTGTSYAWVEEDWNSGSLDPEFIDAMVWLRSHTPDPGIEPFQMYDQGQYQIPPYAYSVITPWVYGYAANYWSKRPVSTSGNKETHGALVESLYGSHNQTYNDNVIKSLKARYIVLSADILNDEFPMYIMRGSRVAPEIDPDGYIGFVSGPTTSGEMGFYPEYYQPFFETLAIHLYLFDGGYYPGMSEGLNDVQGSGSMMTPPGELEALSHFRLVYESGRKVTPHTGPVNDSLILFDTITDDGSEEDQTRISCVKVFEYVDGTEITGEGMVEIPVTTNQGRTFLYRQKYINGTAHSPYSRGIDKDGDTIPVP